MRTNRRLHMIVAAGLVALAAGGCGGGSHQTMTHDSAGARTVDVEMRDIAYVPTTVAVHAGETVKFVFHNKGQAVHEAFLGDEAAQGAHEKAMEGGDMGGMKGHEGNEIKVDPGKTASLTHTFGPGESLLIGCHEPGHYQAGMKVTLPVS
jgi:uncharacterized cupredoxin-like copper-binding protein